MMYRRLLAGFVLLAVLSPLALAEDWPVYRRDRQRTAVSGEQLKLPLQQAWAFHSRQSLAAPIPGREPTWAGYPECVAYTLPMVAAEDGVFFTSSAEGRVVRLEAATGKQVWQFIAGAGFNRAPSYHAGKLYCGSDDGCVYCLDAKSGELIWKYDAGPAQRWFLSYGKMKSVWPVMTDVVVDQGVAYFAAGIFPHDGTFLYALNAETGELIWRNGTVSENLWRYALAPGGYLFLTEKDLWVPKDYRGYGLPFYGAPTPFLREDGRFVTAFGSGDDPEKPKIAGLFWPLVGAAKNGVRFGGNSAWKVEGEDKQREAVWNHAIPDRWVDLDSHLGVRMKGSPTVLRYDPDSCTIIVAGDTVFHTAYDSDPNEGTGSGIYARKADTGEVLWSAEIPTRANQLMAAGGRLFAGTRSGRIYCFTPPGAQQPGDLREAQEIDVYPAEESISQAAEAILSQTNWKAGYALVLDCRQGNLAYELARQSDMYVCAVFHDAELMKAAQEKFVRSGLHVSRIVTMLREPGEKLPYPANFADLVVSENAVTGGELPAGTDDWLENVKPIRGVALIGGAQAKADIEKWIEPRKQQWSILETAGVWAKYVRPPLPEAGSWTHMYGDAGRTLCSHDGALKAPLGVVWYGPPFMRWGTDQTALIVNGILVNPDAHSLEGYDQYTGRRLWRTEAANIGHNRENVAASEKHIFAKYEKLLVQFDLLTGKEMAAFHTAFGEEHGWNWFAVSEDGKTVYGASAGGIFATEMESGKGHIQWKLGGPEEEQKIQGMTAMSDGRIYVLGGTATEDQHKQAIEEMRKWFSTQSKELREEFESQVEKRDVRELIAIEAATGKLLYRRGVDISNCGGAWLRPTHYGAKRGYNPYVMSDIYTHHDVLLIGSCGQTDKGWSVWNHGGYEARALTARDAKTGNLLWYRFANYRGRPVIVGDTVHAEPWAYDLKTGKKQTRAHAITGQEEEWAWCRYDKQCGIFSGSDNFLFGRSMGLGYHDLQNDNGLVTFWHSRSSCYIDCASGGGMMIKPPQAVGCSCLWSMPFTVAMGQVSTQPTARQVTAQPGPTLPVKHLRIDFGATGDTRDKEGNLWLRSDTQAGHPLLLAYEVHTLNYPGSHTPQRSAFYTAIEDTETPFLFSTAQVGVRRCVLPLTTPEFGKAKFLVRLGFSALAGDTAGSRVFDVKIDGKTVLIDFDIFAAAGKADRAVWREFPVEVEGEVTIDFVAKEKEPGPRALPLINAVEVIRQEAAGLGWHAPLDLWLNDQQRETTALLKLENLPEAEFRGRLAFAAPAGLQITPSGGLEIVLPPGGNQEIELRIAATDPAAVQQHLLEFQVQDNQGKQVLAKKLQVDCLGKRQRRMLHGSAQMLMNEDLSAQLHANLKPNRLGDKLVVSADKTSAGEQAVSYLWFHIPPELRGKIRSARLRLATADPLIPLAQAALRDSQEPPQQLEWGVLRRLTGPELPNFREIKFPQRPQPESATSPLVPVAGNAGYVQASIPCDQNNDASQHECFALWPTPNTSGVVYSNSPIAELRPVLIIDYDPLENP